MSESLLLFIPAYNCAAQVDRLLSQLTPDVQRVFHEVLVVDNRSADDTVAVAEGGLRALQHVRARLLVNDENVGLGGSHKVALQHALEHGHDFCIVLHGDDQASVADVLPLLATGRHREYDALLGSRFMPGARRQGYSTFRTVGNHIFNALFSLAVRRRLLDLGSGLNVFRVSCFADGSHLRLPDDLTFNYSLILLAAHRRWRLLFFPISWREEDQRSNVKMLSQSYRMLRLLVSYVRDSEGTVAAHAGEKGRCYTSRTLYDSVA